MNVTIYKQVTRVGPGQPGIRTGPVRVSIHDNNDLDRASIGGGAGQSSTRDDADGDRGTTHVDDDQSTNRCDSADRSISRGGASQSSSRGGAGQSSSHGRAGQPSSRGRADQSSSRGRAGQSSSRGRAGRSSSRHPTDVDQLIIPADDDQSTYCCTTSTQSSTCDDTDDDRAAIHIADDQLTYRRDIGDQLSDRGGAGQSSTRGGFGGGRATTHNDVCPSMVVGNAFFLDGKI